MHEVDILCVEIGPPSSGQEVKVVSKEREGSRCGGKVDPHP